MESDNLHIDIKRLLEENHKLLEENNKLLKKMRKTAQWDFWIRIAWYIFLLGMPFALYFYILEPYFSALGSSYEIFSAGMQEIPGWKHFNETLESIKNR